MRSTRILATAFALIVLHASAASAQRIDDIVSQVVDAWGRGDAKGVMALSVRDGIGVESREERTGPLSTRQATAVLRRIFEERRTVAIRPGITQIVGGSPRRAFTEITWITRAPDTTEPERLTVFLEFVLRDDRWQITQIRLLP